MVGLFKSLFRGNEQRPVPASAQQHAAISDEQLSEMTFLQVLRIAQSLPKSADAQDLMPIAKRFYTIALFDNHVPDEHREASLALAEALTADLERSLANNPEAIAAVRTANTQLKELARQGGYGSLVWRLNEHPMSSAETIPYIMKPEHRHLVPDFLKTLTTETIRSTKRHMVRQLVLQENYNSHNAVLILHGVVAKGDKAAAALFMPDEYRALLSVPNNYDGGRSVLVRLEILPALSEARPFKPVSDISRPLASTLQEILRKRAEHAETDPRLKALSHDSKFALLLTLSFLRIELARAMLCQIYGEQAAYDVVTLLSNPAVIEQWSRFSKATQVLKGITPGTPVDSALLDAVMSSGGVEARSEDEFNSSREFFDMAVHWLNAERVEFLDSLRGMLRSTFNSQHGSNTVSGAAEDSIGP